MLVQNQEWAMLGIYLLFGHVPVLSPVLFLWLSLHHGELGADLWLVFVWLGTEFLQNISCQHGMSSNS